MEFVPSYLRIDQWTPPRLGGASGSDASVRDSSFPDDGVVMGVPTASRGGTSPTSTGCVGPHPVASMSNTPRHRPATVIRSILTLTLALALFTASIIPTVAGAATITLTSTTLSECVQTTLTWTGGSPPYKLKVSPLNADNNSVTSLLQQYQNIASASLSWTANFTAGTRLQFDITDADGDSNGDRPVTVGAGPNTSCLPAFESSSGSTTATSGSGGSSASLPSGSPSSNPTQNAVSRTGLSAGAIVGIAVGVGVIAVIVTAVTVWCLLKRLLLKYGRRSHCHSHSPSGAHTNTSSPSSSSTHVRADEVRVSWYKRAARRMSLRGREFDIDRPVARSPTFSAVTQRGPLLPVSAYNGISNTLAGGAGSAYNGISNTLAGGAGSASVLDPFRAPTPTDSVIVSGPSSPVSDRGEVSFRQTSYTAPSLLQQSTTSLSDTQSQSRKKRPAHTHNTSDTSSRSAATATSTTELRTRTTSPVLSTSLSHSSGDRESRRDRETSTLASTISSSRRPRTPRSPRHETDAGIRLLGGPTGLEAEGEDGNVGVVVRGEGGEGTVSVVTGSPPPYRA